MSMAIVLVINWCGRAQTTLDSSIPRQLVQGCIRKGAKPSGKECTSFQETSSWDGFPGQRCGIAGSPELRFLPWAPTLVFLNDCELEMRNGEEKQKKFLLLSCFGYHVFCHVTATEKLLGQVHFRVWRCEHTCTYTHKCTSAQHKLAYDNQTSFILGASTVLCKTWRTNHSGFLPLPALSFTCSSWHSQPPLQQPPTIRTNYPLLMNDCMHL